MFKPHRPAGIHPAYRVHGVNHHSKVDHHPGKTHEHPADPHMSDACAPGDEGMADNVPGGPTAEAETPEV